MDYNRGLLIAKGKFFLPINRTKVAAQQREQTKAHFLILHCPKSRTSSTKQQILFSSVKTLNKFRQCVL